MGGDSCLCCNSCWIIVILGADNEQVDDDGGMVLPCVISSVVDFVMNVSSVEDDATVACRGSFLNCGTSLDDFAGMAATMLLL